MTDASQLDRLRAELRRPGRSQTDLAKALGLHPSAVNKMLAGKRDIKARELGVIEKYLRDTNVDIDEAIRRAEAESPNTASVKEVNTGLVSTSYPGPWAVRLDTAENSKNVQKLVDIAMGDDSDNIVAECWYYLFEILKTAVCERLRGINEEDADRLIVGGPLEDFILLKALIATFGILNDLEIEKIESLYKAYYGLRGGSFTSPDELIALLDKFAPPPPPPEKSSVKGRLLTTTLGLASTLFQIRQHYIERVVSDAQAVRKRRKKAT